MEARWLQQLIFTGDCSGAFHSPAQKSGTRRTDETVQDLQQSLSIFETVQIQYQEGMARLRLANLYAEMGDIALPGEAKARLTKGEASRMICVRSGIERKGAMPQGRKVKSWKSDDLFLRGLASWRLRVDFALVRNRRGGERDEGLNAKAQCRKDAK